ncbi:phosphate signaling complex protein PhoU [Curvivirga sp.]|uniref:phosphate signaling complex protein PhoU n=1 Tax=Curvivirga sp. TaxID=2856848 RepID=UPI003B5C7BC1
MNTTVGSDHIVTAYDQDLDELYRLVSQMSGLVETQFANSLKAVDARDEELALKVKQRDKEIDQLEADVDAAAIRLIALRQPMADDLRFIISAMKAASDIERIGDYAKNIGKRTLVMSQFPAMPVMKSVVRMGQSVQTQLRDIFDAFLAGDEEKAVQVWEKDEDIDAHYTSLFREILTYMMEDPRNITAASHLMFVAKNIERVGDLATNIAESIYFTKTGESLADRPKADASKYESLD